MTMSTMQQRLEEKGITSSGVQSVPAVDIQKTQYRYNAAAVSKDNPYGQVPVEDNQDVSKGAAKFDGGKVRVDLVPAELTYATAAALTYGAIKYDEWNWAKGLRKGRIMAALIRHAMKYLVREELDPESGLPHTWHIAACIAMLIASESRGLATEDREYAVDSMNLMEAQFANMKDPRNTVKNGGGSLV